MPLSAGAALAIGAGASALAAGIGGASSHYAARKQLEAVRETNETNLQLAREQNDWNLAQWQREVEWDATPNQLKRWMDAGLNPNSFVNGNVASAPSLESADLANQQPLDYSGFADAGRFFASQINNAADYALRSRQLDQVDRQLDQGDARLGIDTRLADSQIATADKIRRNMDAEFDKIVADTSVSKFIADVNKAELGRIAAQTDLYIAQWQQTAESIRGLRLDNLFKDKTFNLRLRQVSAELANTFAEIDWKRQQIAESMKRVSLMAYDRQIKEQQIEINGLNVHMYRTRNGQIDFDFSLNKRYREMERANQIFVERCKAFSALMGGISSLSSFLPYGRSSRVTDSFFGPNVMSPASSPASWTTPQGVSQFY